MRTGPFFRPYTGQGHSGPANPTEQLPERLQSVPADSSLIFGLFGDFLCPRQALGQRIPAQSLQKAACVSAVRSSKKQICSLGPTAPVWESGTGVREWPHSLSFLSPPLSNSNTNPSSSLLTSMPLILSCRLYPGA